MKNIVVCDIQEVYQIKIDFDIKKFTSYLNESNKDILYFYNGNQTIGTESEDDVKIWLLENGLKESTLFRIEFIDKGCGFYRDYMETLNDTSLLGLIRYMQKNDIHDSRDIESPSVIKTYGISEDRILTEPPFSFSDIAPYDFFDLVGGAKNECLKELQFFFIANNMNYEVNCEFIY